MAKQLIVLDKTANGTNTILPNDNINPKKGSSDSVIKLGPWGGDLKKENWGFQIPKAERIKAITVAASAVIDSIIFIVEDSNGNEETIKFGVPGGTANPKVEFTSGEYLKTIAGAYGTWSNDVYVTSLTFITNKGTYGPYGYEKDRPSGATGVVKFSLPMESEIAGFYGYADDRIKCIGVYARPAGMDPFVKIGPWGRDAEDNWTFQIPTESHIKDITLSHGTVVDSLAFVVKQGNGEEETLRFGGHGGDYHYTVDIGSCEYLAAISGAYADWTGVGVYVTALTFVTNVDAHGPYGREEDWREGPTTGTVKFSLPMDNAEIAGFFGYSDKYLQNIGVYARPRPSPPSK